MQTLDQELKSVIARRLEAAGAREVLAIASTLCGAQAPEPVVIKSGALRFVVEGDTVTDTATGLTWSRENVPGGSMNWKAAGEACAKLDLGGYKDWRLPTIRELLTLVDYEKSDPAIDPAFKCDSSYYWSSTPYAGSPGDYAWLVNFNTGNANWLYQDLGYRVRAVRASQSFDLWHVR